jgi:hypothetical protein
MRRYVEPVLVCARCGKRLWSRDEVRMVAGELYHVLCAAQAQGGKAP